MGVMGLLPLSTNVTNIARQNTLRLRTILQMRHIILAMTLVGLSVAATGSTIKFPRIQHIEFEEPLVIKREDDATLCKKYNRLFLDVLHKSLECSEDYGVPPHKYDECEELSRLLAEYSHLRSYYCYGEQEEDGC